MKTETETDAIVDVALSQILGAPYINNTRRHECYITSKNALREALFKYAALADCNFTEVSSTDKIWRSGCGKSLRLNDPNAFKFCPYCGNKLLVVKG